jgi:hypothetical protein
MNAETKIMLHAFEAMDRILAAKPVVRTEPNPLDRCDVCGALDKYDSFPHTLQAGREIALCDECCK